MPGSAGIGGSQAPQATSIRSDTDPGKGLGMALSSPGIIGTLALGPGKVKEEETGGRQPHVLLLFNSEEDWRYPLSSNCVGPILHQEQQQ